MLLQTLQQVLIQLLIQASDTYVSYIDPITHVTLINNTWSLQTITEEGEACTVAEVLEDDCYMKNVQMMELVIV